MRMAVDGARRVSNNRSMMSPTAASFHPDFPTTGALLGVDHGTRRLGLAVSNSDQTIAAPLETRPLRNPAQDLKYLREVINDYRIVGIVVGLPIRLNGEEGDQARLVRRFGEDLRQKLGLPVDYCDERFSSMEAEVLMWSQGISPTRKKEQLDRLAAQVILQSYLDLPGRRGRSGDARERSAPPPESVPDGSS